ncbi:unnamed protein product [Alopecurus aequalis]
MADEPVLRNYVVSPPVLRFTVGFAHNGFFTGSAELEYIDGTLDFFDNCSCDTWSLLWIHELIRQLNHDIDERLHVYWSMPGKEIIDGLECIEKDSDIVAMIEAVKDDKTLTLFVDHTNFLYRYMPDLIMKLGEEVPNQMPGREVVEDIPIRVREVGNASSAQVESNGTEIVAHSEGLQTDSDFQDSDYDAQDGDDDIFDATIDKEVNDHNERIDIIEQEDDAGLEHDDLHLSREQALELQYRFSEFNCQVDMNTPDFKVGMVFSSIKELRYALKAYLIRERVKVSKRRNEATRLEAVCDGDCEFGCTWYLNASQDSRTDATVVKKYFGNHKCERVWETKTLTAKFLCNYFLTEFRDNQKMDLGTFKTKIQREFNMTPNTWKLRRARKQAPDIIYGDETEQFRLLWDYGEELRKSNPGSTFFLSTNVSKEQEDVIPKQHLGTLYWSYDASKRGFLEGCRPLICIDGCHIKTRYKGIDQNDYIFPIAYGLVEVECTSAWEWFLTILKEDLNITNTAHFTIMSDRQKVLSQVVFNNLDAF